VTHFLAHSLDKSQRVIDWSKRPLTPAQLTYALNDVVYLSQLYPLVSQQLKEWRREAWIQEEMDFLTCPKTYLPDLAHAWKKVKGWAVLKGLNRHSFYFLSQLAAWREKQASLKNKPRRHILGDDGLCGCVVSFQNQDKRSDYPGGDVQEVCEEIAHNVLQLDPSLLPPVPWESPPAEDEKAAYKALSTLLQDTATKAALAPRLIGTRHDLERLIRQWRQGSVDHHQPLLSSWRQTLFGEQALEVLDRILGQG
jgi:ribonuclease D